MRQSEDASLLRLHFLGLRPLRYAVFSNIPHTDVICRILLKSICRLRLILTDLLLYGILSEGFIGRILDLDIFDLSDELLGLLRLFDVLPGNRDLILLNLGLRRRRSLRNGNWFLNRCFC